MECLGSLSGIILRVKSGSRIKAGKDRALTIYVPGKQPHTISTADVCPLMSHSHQTFYLDTGQAEKALMGLAKPCKHQ